MPGFTVNDDRRGYAPYENRCVCGKPWHQHRRNDGAVKTFTAYELRLMQEFAPRHYFVPRGGSDS